jgi:hypothetical protein
MAGYFAEHAQYDFVTYALRTQALYHTHAGALGCHTDAAVLLRHVSASHSLTVCI